MRNLLILWILLCGFGWGSWSSSNDSLSPGNTPGPWINVDFTDSFTEADPQSDITINSATQVTVSTMRRQDNAYLYKDYGAGYFSGSLEFQFEITVTASSDEAAVPGAYFWAITNTAALTIQLGADGPYFRCFADESRDHAITTLVDEADDTVTQSVKYYCTVIRQAGVFTGYLYSDSNRTTLVRDETLSDSTAYRYLTVIGNRDDASGTATISFVVENMRFRFYA